MDQLPRLAYWLAAQELRLDLRIPTPHLIFAAFGLGFFIAWWLRSRQASRDLAAQERRLQPRLPLDGRYTSVS